MSAGSLRFSVLGSGSAGNCTALVLEGATPRVILIDLGLSPRQTRRRLQAVGLSFGAVTDVLLTHLDHDHFYPSWTTALHHSEHLVVRVHARHAPRLRAAGLPSSRLAEMEDDGAVLGDGATTLQPVHLPHDAEGAVGYRIEHDRVRLGYASDLGRVPEALLEAFDGVDALALESNYDPGMQTASLRPEFLKRRIMGGAGHLSNEQCLDAALAIHRRRPVQCLALLHLSRQCNCPRLVRNLYAERAPELLPHLLIADQHQPSPMVRVVGAAGDRPRPAARACPTSLFSS